MGTEAFRLFFVLIVVLVDSVFADYYYRHPQNANRRRITLKGLFSQSYYPSIHFALQQVNSELLSEKNLEFHINETEGTIHVRSYK